MIVPNALWISILVSATTIVNQYYGGLWWAPVVVAAIAAAIKLIQVTTTEPAPTPQSDFGGPAPQRDSAFVRFLVK